MSTNATNIVFSDLGDSGASIIIEIDENTEIVCASYYGANINNPVWKIYKRVYLTDANFSGYPYRRILWPQDPVTGIAIGDATLIAANALTYTFI